MTAPMTFWNWQSSAKRTPPLVALQELGLEEADYRGSPVTAFWIYTGQVFIEEMENGTYHCTIGHDECVFERSFNAEMWLYFTWVVSEVFDQEKWSDATLSTLLGEFSSWSKLPIGSADEMITDTAATPEQKRWLTWFIRTWDAVVDEPKRLFEPTLTARLGDQAIEFGKLSSLLSEAMQAIIDLDTEVAMLRDKVKNLTS